LCVNACKIKQHIPEGKRLYDGGTIVLKSKENIESKGALQDELTLLLRPKHNKKILGIRFRLWSYYRGSRPGAKALSKAVKKKYGEEPVYLSELDTLKTKQLIINRLENRGFYYSSIRTELTEKEKTAKIKYTVSLTKPYSLDTLRYEGDSSMLSKAILKSMDHTTIKKDSRYDLDQLKKERDRIDKNLKNHGFYNFNADYLIFSVDTNLKADKKFNLYLSIKDNIPVPATIPYKIDNIYVKTVQPKKNDPNEDDNNDQDTICVDSVYFIQKGIFFKPDYLERYIVFRPKQVYSQNLQTLTTSRLSAIGAFRYVNTRFIPIDSGKVDSAGYGSLNALINLSPVKRKAIRTELQILYKSNNFAGPALLVNFQNRNLFKAGELLSLSANIGYEAQITKGGPTGLGSYDAGVQAEIVFPRIIAPIRIKAPLSYSIPKTKFSYSYSVLNRLQYYMLNSALLSYGYKWNASRFVTHEINPVSINLIKVSNETEKFLEVLDKNAYLRRSFNEQLIVGSTYTFQYNGLLDTKKRNRFFLATNLDVAGNSIYLIQNFTGQQNQNQKTLFGEHYAQYVKLDIDARNYHAVGKQSQLVTRIFMGAGYSYGNSSSLPYIKQYFSGGPNSIRAFRIRSLGPGIYHPTTAAASSTSFFDQSGDMKFEANIEYRFPIISVVKGAFFSDAGNIWLMRKNASLPGGEFSSRWISQLAVGVGAGLRVDVNFFVLRLDMGIPVRIPYLAEKDRWQTNYSIKNYVWNFAIGYPF
jgi:outer membrane protein insertion porin family